MTDIIVSEKAIENINLFDHTTFGTTSEHPLSWVHFYLLSGLIFSMKYLLSISLFLMLGACTAPVKETKLKGDLSGIYELRSISYKGKGMDTSIPVTDQVKIYTDKYYMYGTTRPDSSAFFGFGTYTFSDTAAIEQSVFNSYALDSPSTTILKISMSDTGYRQTLSGVLVQGSRYDVSETYRSLQEGSSSDLDGVWQQTSFTNITGTDTTMIRNQQFKIYKGGHFMWIHYYPVLNKLNTYKKGYGYGRFTIKDDAVTEILSASNYPQIIGAPVTVNYKMDGNKELRLIFSDGVSITTETYKRLN